MDDDTGFYAREVTVLLEDKGVFSVGLVVLVHVVSYICIAMQVTNVFDFSFFGSFSETKVLACVLKGGAADLAMELYNVVSPHGQVLVVLQYVRVVHNQSGWWSN